MIAHTEVIACPAVREIRLHVATAVTSLWQATEAFLEENGVDPPYWAFPWPGGMALARHLLDHPDLVHGRRVLDLGSGSGLTAIAAALAGARVVVANDIDPVACRAARLNAALNGVEIAVDDSDWLAGEGTPEGARFDVILAGDICYEKPMAERAVGWLRREAARGSRVLLADPGRAYLPGSGLAPIARLTVPTTRDLEDRESREVTVYVLAPGA
ncbi:MAG: 50S ribosomal protein L11 methyltransferase [Azospirillaceae bacterium]